MCDHKNIVLTAEGWYCPDCKQVFIKKPVAPKEVKPKAEAKPKAKPKKASKAADK